MFSFYFLTKATPREKNTKFNKLVINNFPSFDVFLLIALHFGFSDYFQPVQRGRVIKSIQFVRIDVGLWKNCLPFCQAVHKRRIIVCTYRYHRNCLEELCNILTGWTSHSVKSIICPIKYNLWIINDANSSHWTFINR